MAAMVKAVIFLKIGEQQMLAWSAGADASGSWQQLLAAGINDFGGMSPVTRDYVNPEKPWPHVQKVAAATAEAGFVLVPR